MAIVFILFSFFVLESPPNAQPGKSLIFDTYAPLIEQLQYSKPDSVITICTTVIQLASSEQDSLCIGRAWMSIGRTRYIQGNYSESDSWYEKASALWERKMEKKLHTETIIGIGLNATAIENHDKALQLYFKAIGELHALGDSAALAKPYFVVGISYKDLGWYGNHPEMYPLALQWFNMAEEKALTYKNRIILLRNYALRGELYFFQKKYNLAIEDYQKSLNHITDNELWDKGFVLGGLAATYLALQDYTKAIEYASLAIQIQQQLQAKWEESRVQQYLYQAYEATKQYDKAIQSIKRYSELV